MYQTRQHSCSFTFKPGFHVKRFSIMQDLHCDFMSKLLACVSSYVNVTYVICYYLGVLQAREIRREQKPLKMSGSAAKSSFRAPTIPSATQATKLQTRRNFKGYQIAIFVCGLLSAAHTRTEHKKTLKYLRFQPEILKSSFVLSDPNSRYLRVSILFWKVPVSILYLCYRFLVMTFVHSQKIDPKQKLFELATIFERKPKNRSTPFRSSKLDQWCLL